MATIKSVNVADAAGQVDGLNKAQTPAPAPGNMDALIRLGEILGKGLAAASGNEMAVGFANDVKQSNDANRMQPFLDALARGENPALPTGLGAEAQQRANVAATENRGQRTMATLQLLQQLQGTANAQGQIDAGAEQTQTQEAGAFQRLLSQLGSQEKIAGQNIESEEKMNNARVGAQNYATEVNRLLGTEQNHNQGRLVDNKLWESLNFGPAESRPRYGAGGAAGGGAGKSQAIGAMLKFLQSSKMDPAQKKLLTRQVMDSLLKNLAAGGGSVEDSGLDLNDPDIQAIMGGLND